MDDQAESHSAALKIYGSKNLDGQKAASHLTGLVVVAGRLSYAFKSVFSQNKTKFPIFLSLNQQLSISHSSIF